MKIDDRVLHEASCAIYNEDKRGCISFVEAERYAEACITAYLKETQGQTRQKIIDEVADSYHGELANFYSQKGYKETLAGIAEKDFKLADKHREYQNDIRNQVWVEADLIASIEQERE